MVLFTVIGGEGQRDGQPLSAEQTTGLLQALNLTASSPAAVFLIGNAALGARLVSQCGFDGFEQSDQRRASGCKYEDADDCDLGLHGPPGKSVF